MEHDIASSARVENITYDLTPRLAVAEPKNVYKPRTIFTRRIVRIEAETVTNLLSCWLNEVMHVIFCVGRRGRGEKKEGYQVVIV